RLGRRQNISDLCLVYQADRAAPAQLVALYRDDIAVAFGGVVAKRVLAQLAVWHLHFYVRSGGKGRELAMVGAAQLERADAGGRGWIAGGGPCSSRLTGIAFRGRSAALLRRGRVRCAPCGACTFTCDPGVKGGGGPGSARRSSNGRMAAAASLIAQICRGIS